MGAYEKAFPEEISLQEMLALSAEADYDFLEISIDKTDKRLDRLYNQEIQGKLEWILRNSRVKIGSICLSALGT